MAVGPIQGAATSAFSIAGLVGGMIGKGISDIQEANTAEKQHEQLVTQLKKMEKSLTIESIHSAEVSRSDLMNVIEKAKEDPDFDIDKAVSEMYEMTDPDMVAVWSNRIKDYIEAGQETENALIDAEMENSRLEKLNNSLNEELNASKSREFRGFNKYADMANDHLVEAQKQKSIQNQMKARNIR